MHCIFRRVGPVARYDVGHYLFSVDHRHGEIFLSTPILHNALVFKFDWIPGHGWQPSPLYPGNFVDRDWQLLLADEDWECVPVSLNLV